MKKLIEFLNSRNIFYTIVENDIITIKTTEDDFYMMNLANEIEDYTMEDDFCYTIIGNEIVKIEI